LIGSDYFITVTKKVMQCYNAPHSSKFKMDTEAIMQLYQDGI